MKAAAGKVAPCGAAWLPIDDAPRDGSLLVLLSIDRTAHVGWWDPYGTSWADAAGRACDTGLGTIQRIGHWQVDNSWLQPNEVTHWQPLAPGMGA